MRQPFTSCFLLVSTLVFAPSLALPAALSIGQTCEIGNCTAVDSISYPTVIPTTPFSFNYTVGSDTYSFVGTYTAGYTDNGTNIGLNVNATYTGTTPSKTADTIPVNLFQNVFDNSAGTWDGVYSEHIPVAVGQGGTFSGQLLFDGQSVGLIGPLGAGTYDITKSTNLTGLGTGNILSADYSLMFTFAAGAAPGTAVDVLSSIPEPSQTLPVALGLVGLGVFAYRRKAYTSQR